MRLNLPHQQIAESDMSEREKEERHLYFSEQDETFTNTHAHPCALVRTHALTHMRSHSWAQAEAGAEPQTAQLMVLLYLSSYG